MSDIGKQNRANMTKDQEYIKATVKIPRDTWIKIRELQKSRHVHSIQHAVEIGLEWVVATAKERRKKEETNCK